MATDTYSTVARDAVLDTWQELPHHPFVTGMADGSLEPERYRYYVSQNLLYLPQYARAIAMAVAKSRNDDELTRYTASLGNIVDVEIPQNQRLLERITAMCADPTTAVPREMAPAARNYTSYLLAVAGSSDVVGIGAAILPCAWSYGEIARHHIADVAPHPVYREWFEFFASDAYAELVTDMRSQMDADVATVSEADQRRLMDIFATATQLEQEFWDMAATGAEPVSQRD